MSNIIVGRTKCKITEESDAGFLQALDRELSFKVQGAEHTWAYKQGQWNGVKHILTSDLTFPYGLLERVKLFYTQREKPFSITNRRPLKTDSSEISIQKNLVSINRDPYPYQWDTLEAVKSHDCGIIRVATGGGKCSHKDSLHVTEYGIVSYLELLNEKNIKLKPQEAIHYKCNVATPLNNSNIDSASSIYRDGISKSFKIKTTFGYEITATHDHKIKILNKEGIVWKKVGNLQKGDFAVLSPGTNLFGKRDDLSIDDAYWAGLLLGDGSYSNMNYVSITNEDDHILNFSRSYLKKKKISFIDKFVKNKTFEIRCNNVIYRKKILKDFGFKPLLSINKEIPIELRKLKRPLLAMVVRGLFETDGWIGKEKSKPTINIGLSSKKIIDQLHLILLNFGIVASRRIKKTTHEDNHILTIYRDYIHKFIQTIGFDHNGRKHRELKNQMSLMQNKIFNANSNLIFNQENKIKTLFNKVKLTTKNLKKTFSKYGLKYNTIRSWSGDKAWRRPSKAKLLEVLIACKEILKNQKDCCLIINELEQICSDSYFYNSIEIIEEVDSDNYDFVVPKTHSFVSQGFINHNTLIAAMATAHFGKRAIIYVIGKDLLYQIHDFFSKIFDEEIGIIGDSKCEIRDINVCSVWTIGQALGLENKKILLDTSDKEKNLDKEKYKDILDLMRTAKVHIFDECHLASCDTIQKIASKINPEHVYGMSASPWRDDGSDLLIEGIFGSTIMDISASYLIKNGYLAKPIIKFQRVPKMTFKKSDTYQSVYKRYISENEQRNALIVKGTKALVNQGYRPLVLFSKLKHGKLLFDEIKKEIPAMMLSGKDSSKTRESVKEKFENKDIQCIVASTIFDIGVDIPALSGLVIAGGGKSSVRACQRIGRVIRRYKKGGYEKKHAAVIDFYDQAKFLKNHSVLRYKIYSFEEEFSISWPK